jgi:hypothetical protein
MKGPANRWSLSLLGGGILIVGLLLFLFPRPLSPPTRPNETAHGGSAAPARHSNAPSTPAILSGVPEPAEMGPAGLPKPAREKVEAYLTRHRRNASSLLAAFHGMDDTNYLLEAARNFPEDPQVQWTVLMRHEYPEDRRKWLDSFKASSPSNSLANYLSAQDYFNAGDSNAAMQEIRAATGKTQFDSFETSAILDAEEMFLSSGQSPLESFNSAMSAIAIDTLPELASYKLLSQGIAGVQRQYAAAGNPDSLANASQAGIAFADQIRSGDSGKYLINGMVGLSCEAIVLEPLDPNAAYAFLNGQTPSQRLDEIKQIKQEIRDLHRNFTAVFPALTESERFQYMERSKIYGEYEAMRWLKQQYGRPPQAQ